MVFERPHPKYRNNALLLAGTRLAAVSLSPYPLYFSTYLFVDVCAFSSICPPCVERWTDALMETSFANKSDPWLKTEVHRPSKVAVRSCSESLRVSQRARDSWLALLSDTIEQCPEGGEGLPRSALAADAPKACY